MGAKKWIMGAVTAVLLGASLGLAALFERGQRGHGPLARRLVIVPGQTRHPSRTRWIRRRCPRRPGNARAQ